jgi:hypothetical protein
MSRIQKNLIDRRNEHDLREHIKSEYEIKPLKYQAPYYLGPRKEFLRYHEEKCHTGLINNAKKLVSDSPRDNSGCLCGQCISPMIQTIQNLKDECLLAKQKTFAIKGQLGREKRPEVKARLKRRYEDMEAVCKSLEVSHVSKPKKGKRGRPFRSSNLFYNNDMLNVLIDTFLKLYTWSDLIKLRCVSLRYKTTIDKKLLSVKQRIFESPFVLPNPKLSYPLNVNKIWRSFYHTPNVTQIAIKNAMITNGMAAAFTLRATKLRQLNIFNSEYMDRGFFQLIANLGNVTKVYFNQCRMDGNILDETLRNEKLQVLFIKNNTTPILIYPFIHMKARLTSLGIDLQFLTNQRQFFECLAKGNGVSIRNLRVTKFNLNDENMTNLIALKNLEYLSFEFITTKPCSLLPLSKLESLRSLFLYEINETPNEHILSDANIINMTAHFPKLTDISFATNNKPSVFTERIFPHIHQNMKSLKYLGLCNSNMTNKELRQLSIITSLTRLNLIGLHLITNEGVANYLKSAPNLQELKIKVCPHINVDIGKYNIKRQTEIIIYTDYDVKGSQPPYVIYKRIRKTCPNFNY